MLVFLSLPSFLITKSKALAARSWYVLYCQSMIQCCFSSLISSLLFSSSPLGSFVIFGNSEIIQAWRETDTVTKTDRNTSHYFPHTFRVRSQYVPSTFQVRSNMPFFFQFFITHSCHLHNTPAFAALSLRQRGVWSTKVSKIGSDRSFADDLIASKYCKHSE